MDRLMGGEQIDMKIPLEAFYELPHRREEPEQLESTSIAYSDGVESDPIVPDFLRYMGRG
jgi:hypothetical protein